MEIGRCNSIEEIVSKEKGGESDEDEIIFPQLNCLYLYKLLNLRRFYRESLSFPLLNELSITDCHEMITLCEGTLKASKSYFGFNYSFIPLETMRKEFLKKVCV